MSLKVLIIDDHRLFRDGLKSLLQRRNIEVVAAVGDGNEGISLIPKLDPDIILLDMRMPIVDGISVLKAIKEKNTGISVTMLTTSASESDLLDALKNGANGYLLKDMEPDALVSALHEINKENIIVAPDLTSVLARFIQGNVTPMENKGPFKDLTPRESEIIQLLSEGQSNKLIARNLGISDGTVKLHVKSILKKLGVQSRIEAAVRFIEFNHQKVN